MRIRAAPSPQSASLLRAVEARAARQAAQDRRPARCVRLGFAVADAVPLRDRLHGVGEDGKSFIQVLVVYDQRRNQPTRLVDAGRQREQPVRLALLRNLTREARQRLVELWCVALK